MSTTFNMFAEFLTTFGCGGLFCYLCFRCLSSEREKKMERAHRDVFIPFPECYNYLLEEFKLCLALRRLTWAGKV